MEFVFFLEFDTSDACIEVVHLSSRLIHSSCFQHFLKNPLGSTDFVEINFENGCCKPIFEDVFKKIKESFR